MKQIIDAAMPPKSLFEYSGLDMSMNKPSNADVYGAKRWYRVSSKFGLPASISSSENCLPSEPSQT